MCRKLFLFILVLALASTNVVFGAVWEGRISSSEDDWEEYFDGGLRSATSSDIEMPYEDEGQVDLQISGLRFVDVAIPPGANIINAYIEFTVDETKGGEDHVSILIEGEKTSNAAPISRSNDVVGRTRTEAKVIWVPENWTQVDQVSRTSDISSIIQEILQKRNGQPTPADGSVYEDTWASLSWKQGWESGNSMLMIISNNPDDTSIGLRCAESFDGESDQAAFLHIEYTTGQEAAVTHDVYLGDNFDDVNDGAEGTFQGNQATTNFVIGFPGFPYPDGLVPGSTYYWRVDMVEADGTKHKGDVWSFWILPRIAYNPFPADGIKYVDQNVELSWEAGFRAKMHTVYIGDNFDDVNNATGGLPQTSTTYTPGLLEPDKTYYWRIDESDPPATHKGDIWSFRTLHEIPITDPNLVGWWTFDEGKGTTALDRSGHGNHGKLFGPEWVAPGLLGDAALNFDGSDYVAIQNLSYNSTGNTGLTVCAWIRTSSPDSQYIASFDRNEYWRLAINTTGSAGAGQVDWDVWTDAGQNDYGSVTRVDDGQWHHVCGVFDNGRSIIYIDGKPEPSSKSGSTFGRGRYIRYGFIGANSEAESFDGNNSGGPPVPELDDLRIYDKALTVEEILQVMRGDPLLAWDPKPVNGSTPYIRDVIPLSWSPGDTASEHDVYFGTDRDVVVNADETDTTSIYRGRQVTTSYTPPEGVEWGGGPYYWRIDEYNTDGTISKGNVWSFTVADYLLVDDFESYNDLNPEDPDSNRIFNAWLDGYDDPTNGSLVGYDNPPFAEQTIVHNGRQSMPLYYDNSVGYSEVTMTLADRRDWTVEDVGVLSLWFYGVVSNAAEPLYVALNGNAIVTNDDPNAAQVTAWTEWTIDLQTFADQGVNLTNVNSISLGLGNKNNPLAGGSGTMYFDDIRLYAPAP